MISQKPATVLRIAYALLAFILGLSAIVVYTLVPSDAWVRITGMGGAHALPIIGILVLSGRGPGGRLILSGKGPSSRFVLTRQPWKYVVVGATAALSTMVGFVTVSHFLVHPALPLIQWLLIALLANLIEPLKESTSVDNL